MAKIIYHLGTGTYFALDDDVVVIDTDEVPVYSEQIMESYHDEIAVEFGKRITDVVTVGFCINCDKPLDKTDGYCSQYCEDFDKEVIR